MKKYAIPAVSLFFLSGLVTGFVWFATDQRAEAHCQVPCGIYGDSARIAAINEDRDTIAKCIAEINRLAGARDANSFNQAVRWVTTKDAHADHIMSVVCDYFLAQKVKPVAPGAAGYDDYLKSLAEHHAVIVTAMKTKQSADTKTVADLSNAINKLALRYPAATKKADAAAQPDHVAAALIETPHTHADGTTHTHPSN